jgi:hypothetical protein
LILSQIETTVDPAIISGLTAELRQAIEYQQTINDPIERLQLPIEIHLERILPLALAAKLRGCSVSTLVRNYSEYFVDLGPGKRGMRVKHALSLEQPPRKSRSRVSPKRRRGHGDAEMAKGAG